VQRDGNNMDRDQPDAKKGYKGKHPRLGKWLFNCCPLIYSTAGVEVVVEMINPFTMIIIIYKLFSILKLFMCSFRQRRSGSTEATCA